MGWQIPPLGNAMPMFCNNNYYYCNFGLFFYSHKTHNNDYNTKAKGASKYITTLRRKLNIETQIYKKFYQIVSYIFLLILVDFGWFWLILADFGWFWPVLVELKLGSYDIPKSLIFSYTQIIYLIVIKYEINSQILYHVTPPGQFCHPWSTGLATGLIQSFLKALLHSGLFKMILHIAWGSTFS